MDALLGLDFLYTPGAVAVLAAVAVIMAWIAFAPPAPRRDVQERLDDYLERGDIVMDDDMSRSLVRRALWPALRGLLGALGRLLPNRGLERVRRQLQQAGNPYGLSPLDFYGARVLLLILLVGGALALSFRGQGLMGSLQMVVLAAFLGYILPLYWLRTRVRGRRHAILRALPDALDMLTIGVEAGLAFESAMVRVGEKWDNALSREFRRAVAEMRVGATREAALTRMAERCDTPDLTTFVAVLVQSSQLGVSIAQVLHGQAQAMRQRRRQRAEELARQAGIKMLIPLVFFIFPALMVAILGPTVPALMELFAGLTGP